MNIRNLSYLAATQRIRQPDIGSIDSDLVFVYPMVVVKKNLSEEQVNLIRDFVSVTFLKEIFVENFLNLTKLAVSTPIQSKESVDVLSTISDVLYKSRRFSYYEPQAIYQPTQDNQLLLRDIQEKLNKKSAKIQQYLRTDPKLSKLRPFVEWITMGNMIDVPVIVGTYKQEADAVGTFHLLLASLALNVSLGDSNTLRNLDKIAALLDSMNPSDYFTLLNNLVQANPDKYRKNLFTVLGEKFKKVIELIENVKQKLTPDFSKISATERKSLLDFVKGSYEKTVLPFKLCIDKDALYNIVGIRISDRNAATSDTVVRVGELKSVIFDNILSNYHKSIGTIASVVLKSCSQVLRSRSSELDFSELKKQYIDDQLMSELSSMESPSSTLSMIKSELDKALQSDRAQFINIITSSCKSLSDEVKNLSAIQDKITSKILPANFTEEQVLSFALMIDDLRLDLDSSAERLLKKIKVLSSDLYFYLVNNVKGLMQDKISQLLDKYYIENARYDQIILDPRDADEKRRENLKKILDQMVSSCTSLFFYLFIINLVSGLCSLLEKFEYEYRTTQVEVISWPNYILVLPIEIISSLHAAFVARTWQSLLSRNIEVTQSYDLTDNYVKNIVKMMVLRLNIPNIFVIDKNDIYYKLMYQSTVNKTNFNTISSFVSSTLNQAF